MQETRVTFEQAKKLKESGFDWECNAYWYFGEPNEKLFTNTSTKNHNGYGNVATSAPTLSHACMWLREVKGLHVHAEPHTTGSGHWYSAIFIYNKINKWEFYNPITDAFTSYYDALSAGIDKALTLI